MNIAASLYLVIHNLYSSLRIFLPWSHNYAGNKSAKIWKENRSACCCNNNVNAFLTCITRSTLVCAQLIIVPLIYSLYFSPSRWLKPSPCLHSFRSGVLCSLWGGKKREVFRHAIGRERTHARTHEGPRGRDVEIKWTRKRTADRRGRRRFYALSNHSYLLKYKQKYARAFYFANVRISSSTVRH